MGELLINKEVWDGLPEDLQALIHVAVRDTAARWFVWFHRRNADLAYQELTQKHGVQVIQDAGRHHPAPCWSRGTRSAELWSRRRTPSSRRCWNRSGYASLIVPYRLSIVAAVWVCGQLLLEGFGIRQDAGVVTIGVPDGQSGLAARVRREHWRQAEE